MAASKAKTCPCGSGRVPTMRCMGIDFCSACADGTDDRPSLLDVRDSPEAIARRAERLGNRPTPTPTRENLTVTLTEHTEPEPDDLPTAPEGFVTRRSVNGGTTTMRAPRTAVVRAPSPASLGFLRTLLAEREGVTEAEAIRTVLNEARANGNLSQSLVSSSIDCLKRLPKPRQAQPTPGRAFPTLPDVPAGHYAIATKGDGENDLSFYRVDRPTEGQYAGRTFVKHVVGGKPDANVPYARVADILARILADPESGPRYGQEIGRCCRCNRHLTNKPSRDRGIGPECATK